MKIKTLTPVAVCLIFAGMISCGGQQKKVENFGETFAGYVNSNKLDSIKAVYPTANFDSVMPVAIDSISVLEAGKDKYQINFGSNKWIEVKVNEDGSMTVMQSNGIAAFPTDKYQIALNTGMVTDTVYDTQVHELLNDSNYFAWLEKNMKQPIGLVKGKISKKFGVDLYGRPCEGAVERMTCTVTNNTEKPISGKDYDITYAYSYWTCSDGSSPDGHTTGKKNGVDLAPGQSAEIKIAIMDYGLKNVALKYNVPVEALYNGMNPFSGKEYQEYLKQEADRDNVNYDWLSTREVTPADLENKSKEELRIMRNWIYAKHGYIFKSQDLADYYSQFPWYKPTSSNVSSQLNKIEKSNIEAIQAYE